LGTTFLAAASAFVPVAAFAQDAAAGGSDVETVVVTGYAASLAEATNAKRNAVNFSDSVFAEDIGKFPDSDIAESLNRIPGITISREDDGEGVNVSIRGLGTDFTKILLNGAQISVASTGFTDATNSNREVDLNMFPTELFNQLTVNKSTSADTVEGGAAGTINMRSDRPFDNEGEHITYSAQGSDYTNASSLGERGSLIASDTWGSFGALIGVAGVHNNVMTTGWEDGNGGWVTPGALTAAQCGANTCDSIGGNAFAIPNTVPAGISANGLTPGATIDNAFLTSHNPAVTTAQLSNALIPRLGRTMFEGGSRDRYNGIISLEYRPSDSLHFYLDTIVGRTFNNENRSDVDWGVRAGTGAQNQVPLNVQVNQNNVTTSATFDNAQFFLEARPYKEKGDFLSLNPGMEWQPLDELSIDFQANVSRSHFFRDSPTVLVVTPPGAEPTGIPGATPPPGGVFVTFSNTGSLIPPTVTPNIDLDNPANFQWNNGRVNLQDEKRFTQTDGMHLDAKYGDDDFNVKVGGAFDDTFRNIVAIDDSQQWQNAICGDNPSAFLPAPNSQPPCNGLNIAEPAGTTGANAAAANTANTPASANFGATTSFPLYPGYGTGYSTGFAPLSYTGSLIPQSALSGFLVPGPTGFVTVNYNKLEAASGYNAFDQAAINAVYNAQHPTATNSVTYPFATAGATGVSAGQYDEKTYGFYTEVNGILHFDQDLKYNIGMRWVQTAQSITSPIQHTDPRNATGGAGGTALTDGGEFPNFFTFATAKTTYSAFLPSVNLVYNVTDNFLLRFSASRTMTRANPSQMVSSVNFSDPNAAAATLGNPNLKPFYSNNIDFGAELYTGGAGYVGITYFRKSISDFTTNVNSTEPFGFLGQFGYTFASLGLQQQAALEGRGCSTAGVCPASVVVTVTQPENEAGLLIVNGMELDYVQPLDFLLEQHGLKGFGFTGNVTILDQRSTGIVPANATGIPGLSYNLTGYYENNGASVRLSYVWNDKSYGSASNNQNVCLPSTASSADGCPGGAYIFTAPYGQMDLSTSYRLSNIFGDLPSDPELTFDVQNLTKSKIRSYDQYTDMTHVYYNFGSVYLFGIRGTF
jgi:TonB-dependent receptor